jgi:site-specific DNA-cytosine methylase
VFIMAHRIDQGLQGWLRGWQNSGREDQHGHSGCSSSSAYGRWPSRPGQPQFSWEPPRVVANSKRSRGEEPEHLDANLPSKPSWRDSEVVGNADHGRLASSINARSGTEADQGGQSDIEQAEPRQAEPPLGGNPNGTSDWMDYAELYTTCDNRTDELRLLGNGVVPATAERAFRTLLTELLTNQP